MTQRKKRIWYLSIAMLLVVEVSITCLAYANYREKRRAYGLYDRIHEGMSRDEVETILGHNEEGEGNIKSVEFAWDIGDYTIWVTFGIDWSHDEPRATTVRSKYISRSWASTHY